MSDERDMPQDEKALDNGTDSEQPKKDADVESVESIEVDASAVRIEELEKQLATAQATIEGQKDGVLRARADADNARRRADAEVEKARKFALERFAGELLTVIDNLERAITAAEKDNDAVKPLLEGVEMTHKGFIDTVAKFGMEEVNPVDEPFDPERHQAMSMQESDSHAPNTVMAVLQKGYVLNGRLLRPAMVMVARTPDGGVDTQA